jgi:taurine transport system substrate-binding protein
MFLRAVTAVATTVLLLGAAGCSGGGDSHAPKKIVIGYRQIADADLVLKHNKWLEGAFGSGTKIEWKQFDSGDSVNKAIQAGSVDIGLLDSSAAARGISAGIKYHVPWIADVIGNAEALVVKSTVTQVKGKKIGAEPGSMAQYSLVAAAKGAKVVGTQPDAMLAAWKSGAIDGAYVGNPVLAELKAAGGKTLLTSADLAAQGKTTYDLAVVTDKFAKTYPDAVKVWITQENLAVKQIKSSPALAASAIAAELKVPVAEAKAQLSGLIFVTAGEQTGNAYLGGKLAQNLYAAALLEKPDVDGSLFQEAVDASYALAAPPDRAS